MTENSNDLIIRSLEEAMALEMDGERYYRDAACRTTDTFSRNLLNRLAEDEVEHHNILASELKLLNELENVKGNTNLSEGRDKLCDIDFTEKRLKIFPKDPGLIKRELCKDEKNLHILQTAIQKEEESISLYSYSVQKIQDDSMKRFFQHMAKIERGHKEILSDYLAFLEEPEAAWDNMERWACQT